MKLFIVNDFDRPDERHIAEQRPDGKFYYVHPDLRDIKDYWGMTPDRPTPLEDFGIRTISRLGVLTGALTDRSIATYRDGRPRKWQGSSPFSFPLA